VRTIAVAVGALLFWGVAPISAKVKTDLSKCEQRCHEYQCFGTANMMHCHYASHKRCLFYGPSTNTTPH
jgi:hypothetical protein